ncbi:MAG: PAS domain S-box protein [Bacteroidota bacterium]
MKKTIDTIPDYRQLYDLALSIGPGEGEAIPGLEFMAKLMPLLHWGESSLWRRGPRAYVELHHLGNQRAVDLNSQQWASLEKDIAPQSYALYQGAELAQRWGGHWQPGPYLLLRLDSEFCLLARWADAEQEDWTSQVTLLWPLFEQWGRQLDLYFTLRPHLRAPGSEQPVEEALRETEERYRIIFENAFDGIIIFDAARNIPLSCNPQALEYFGVNEERFLSATPLDFSPPFQPDGRSSVESRNEILRQLEQHKLLRYEWQHRRLNGELFDTEVSTFTMPAPNEHLRISILRDITEGKRATLALKQSEARLRQTQQLAQIGNFEYDFTKDVMFWSDETFHIFGMDPAEGAPNFEYFKNHLLHPHDVPLFMQRMESAITQGQEFELESRHIRADGKVIYTHNLVKVYRDQGRYTKLYGAIQDITERYKATRALRKSENSLREAQQLAKLGSWEYHIQSQRIQWSEETYRIFGMDPLAGEPNFEAYMEQLVHPEDAQALQQCVEVAIEHNQSFAIESRQRKITGEAIYTVNVGKPIQRNGEVYKLVGTTQDITERKLAEQKIVENNQKYLQLFDNMYDAIVVADVEGRMIDSNKAAQRMLGYSREELMGLQIPQIVHPDDMERSQQYLKKLATDGYYSDYQGRILRKDGQVVYIQVNSNAIYDEEGRMTGSRDIVRDITALKKAEFKREELLAELEQVNQELQDFAYVVSHDLKAPLRAISSLSQWLQEDYRDQLGEMGAQQLDLLVSRANRMHSFIEAILEYSRIGRVQEREEWLDLNRILEIIREEMLEVPADFDIQIPERLPRFYGQKMRLIQLFQNLVGNAIKYNDKTRGRVEIRWAEEPTHYRFWVRDNGPGIAPKYYEKIFQIFQTLQSRDVVESTGIGLTIVKRIVQLYEGQIEVNSELGVHTTFEFTLKKH